MNITRVPTPQNRAPQVRGDGTSFVGGQIAISHYGDISSGDPLDLSSDEAVTVFAGTEDIYLDAKDCLLD